MMVPFGGEEVVAERLPRRRSDDLLALAVGIGARDENVPDIDRISEQQRGASDIEADGITGLPVAGREKSRLVEKKPRRGAEPRHGKPP